MKDKKEVKGFCDLEPEELQRSFEKAAQDGISQLHSKGIPAVLADENGIYELYPDGEKKYLKLYTSEIVNG